MQLNKYLERNRVSMRSDFAQGQGEPARQLPLAGLLTCKVTTTGMVYGAYATLVPKRGSEALTSVMVIQQFDVEFGRKQSIS